MPAPALPVWPPPTTSAGRRDEVSPSAAKAVPRQSTRPGLLPPAEAVGNPTPRPHEVAPTTPDSGDRWQSPGGGATPETTPPGGAGLSAYYGDMAGSSTVAFPVAEENSGSLTGHILAQGWTETARERSTSTVRVVIVMVIALIVLVTISVLVVLLANDALSSVTG
ncbi:hypothetical protein Jiend_25070 [Micromonospora endophytica]|nr:hypothetical protein D3H59_05290 [Micromonospora endophytica]BCJ59085.1 hypothetical protein Jiend_25070 [Micromonospora endophytica]